MDFCRRVRRLIEGSSARGLTPTVVDHYYWLRGMFDGKGELRGKINLEARLVLSAGDAETVRLVGELKGVG